HVAVRNADQVLVVQPGELVVNRFGGVMRLARDDFFDRKRPASIQEHLENPRGRRGLSRGAAGPAPSLAVEGGELVGRQDHEIRQWRPGICVEPPPRPLVSGLAGIVNVNVEPWPTALLIQIRPPCSSTNFRQSARPSPVPSAFFSALPT